MTVPDSLASFHVEFSWRLEGTDLGCFDQLDLLGLDASSLSIAQEGIGTDTSSMSRSASVSSDTGMVAATLSLGWILEGVPEVIEETAWLVGILPGGTVVPSVDGWSVAS